jgi:hypothetical protein
MKTKKYLFIPFLLAILISSLFANVPVKPAFAQEQCVDASGAPIPCPPTAEIPCGQPGGPACPPTKDGPNPTPRPTRTSQPIANPTEETSTAGASWSGSCANAGPVNDPCLLKLMDACYDAGGDSTVGNADENGTVTVTCALPAVRDPNAPRPLVSAPTRTPLPDENYLGSCSNNDRNIFDCFEKFTCEDGLLVIKVDLYSGNGTKYDFYCIPDESTPLLDLPLSLPDPKGKVANWTGGCSAGAGLDACLDLMSAGCAEEGGDVSIWYDDDGGAGVYCENQSEARQPAPEATSLPLSNPTAETRTADWFKFCSNSDGAAYATCLVDASSSCTKEGGSPLPITHEDGATVSCRFPTIVIEPTPLPLVVAPQTGETSGESWDESCSWASCWAYDLTCWSSGGSGYGVEDSAGNTGYHCDLPDSTTGQNNLKQLALGVLVGIVLIGLLVPAINKVRDAAAKGRSARMLNNKNPELVKSQDDGATEGGTPPPPPPPPPPPSNSSDLAAWRANYGPSSQNKPKPKPKPSKGDFNSDGDVDGRDFNP